MRFSLITAFSCLSWSSWVAIRLSCWDCLIRQFTNNSSRLASYDMRWKIKIQGKTGRNRKKEAMQQIFWSKCWMNHVLMLQAWLMCVYVDEFLPQMLWRSSPVCWYADIKWQQQHKGHTVQTLQTVCHRPWENAVGIRVFKEHIPFLPNLLDMLAITVNSNDVTFGIGDTINQ